MNRWLWLLESALVVTLGSWAGPLAAQTPTPTPSPYSGGYQAVIPAYAVVPVVPHDATSPDTPPRDPPQRGPLRKLAFWVGNSSMNFANSNGFACWSTHNSVGCGNIPSDLTFMFGSCRQFFGEPCLQCPGAPPRPQGGHGNNPPER